MRNKSVVSEHVCDGGAKIKLHSYKNQQIVMGYLHFLQKADLVDLVSIQIAPKVEMGWRLLNVKLTSLSISESSIMNSIREPDDESSRCKYVMI